MHEESDLIGRLNKLKKEIQSLWTRLSEDDFEINQQKINRGKKNIKNRLGQASRYNLNQDHDDLNFSEIDNVTKLKNKSKKKKDFSN